MDSGTRETLVAGLEQAMRAETDGYHFYQMAARSTQDPKGQEVFQTLALEELDHYRFLEHQRDSILREGMVDAHFSLTPRLDLAEDSPIFSHALRARAGEAHFEMSALSIGIQLELNARTYYSEQAESASLEEVRLFYRRLADWESRHYQALLRQQEGLKEDYWAAGGFAPF